MVDAFRFDDLIDRVGIEMKRPVTVFEYTGNAPLEKREVGKGYAIAWHQIALAQPGVIVEMPDGSVKAVDVDLIRLEDTSEIGMAILNVDTEAREKLQAVINTAVEWYRKEKFFAKSCSFEVTAAGLNASTDAVERAMDIFAAACADAGIEL